MFDLTALDQISHRIDQQLEALEGFATLLKEVKLSLDVLHARERSNYEVDFALLQSMVSSGSWPSAVDADMICDEEEQAVERAESILDIFVGEDLNGKRFLDFGCGEGHTIAAASARGASKAIGYDLKKSARWASPNLLNDIAAVRKHGPFDVILLHDVLDHAEAAEPAQLLKQAAGMLAASGRIYLRLHPWCSRHGGHLYEIKNAAYLHLVMDDAELAQAYGIAPRSIQKVLDPIVTYRTWIAEAGLTVKEELPTMQNVEHDFYFGHPPSRNRLLMHWRNEEEARKSMEITNVEYILEFRNPNARMLS